jgi:hypothetical protein
MTVQKATRRLALNAAIMNRGSPMKKLIAVSLIMAGIVMATGLSAPVQSQSPASDPKPTFISPTPGLYVSGWPPFTVAYPQEWVEGPLTGGGSLFQVLRLRPDLPPSPVLTIFVFPSALPLEDWAKFIMPNWVNVFTYSKVLSDKPSQLKDGTPAREVEVEFGPPKFDALGRNITNGQNGSGLYLATKKDLTWVTIFIAGVQERPGEDWKKVAYSLTFQPDREKPITVPPDVRAFLDMYCTDMVSRDLNAIMAHYSDRFVYSAMNKAFHEQWFRNDPISPIQTGITSCEATITVFEHREDKAYIDGFFMAKVRGDASPLQFPMRWQQIINENGQWKWFGNQK